nr:hypothetical protein [Clostridia bacterium]
MNTPFPTVSTWPLPSEALTHPAVTPAPEAAQNAPADLLTDTQALCEALTPAISAAIARRARQRRYTR